jgi:hypothetical protein
VLSQKPSGLCVSAEELLDIEQELSQPLFRGVPIGSTLGDIYYLELFLGHANWGTGTHGAVSERTGEAIWNNRRFTIG